MTPLTNYVYNIYIYIYIHIYIYTHTRTHTIELQHGLLKMLNAFLLFFSFSFNITFQRLQTCNQYFCYFNVKWKETLKWNFKPTAWLPFIRGFYSDHPPFKDARIHTRFGIGKTQSYAAKTRENPKWWAFLSAREIAYWSSTGSSGRNHRRINQRDLKKKLLRALIQLYKYTPVTWHE